MGFTTVNGTVKQKSTGCHHEVNSFYTILLIEEESESVEFDSDATPWSVGVRQMTVTARASLKRPKRRGRRVQLLTAELNLNPLACIAEVSLLIFFVTLTIINKY